MNAQDIDCRLGMNMRVPFLSLGVLGALACREKPPSGFITFQVSARPDGAAADSGPPTGVVALGKDTIILQRVRMVLAELAIAPSEAQECEEEEGEDNPPCVEFDEHPVVIELPLDRPVASRSTLPAPVTSYSLFQAVLHPATLEDDSALVRGNPDVIGASVLVEGIVSRAGKRTPFSFNTDFAEKEEITLEPALTVAKGDSLHVTLRVDVASWFKSEDGKTLIDPVGAGPGGKNQHLVRDHIRTSIAVFIDQNGDGQADTQP